MSAKPKLPAAGGSYIRDAKTGELDRKAGTDPAPGRDEKPKAKPATRGKTKEG